MSIILPPPKKKKLFVSPINHALDRTKYGEDKEGLRKMKKD